MLCVQSHLVSFVPEAALEVTSFSDLGNFTNRFFFLWGWMFLNISRISVSNVLKMFLNMYNCWAPRVPRKWNPASPEQKSQHHRRPQGHASSTWTKERRSSKSGTAADLSRQETPEPCFYQTLKMLRSSAKLSVPVSKTTRHMNSFLPRASRILTAK